MLDLRTHIEEALFDKKGIDPEKAAEKFYYYENIKKSAYKINKPIFDEETGYVHGTAAGLDIYAPMWPKGKSVKTLSKGYVVNGAQEFNIKSNASKLDFKISKFKGNMYISCQNLTSLEGIFTPDCEFEGRLSIWHCYNLKSLKGLPRVISPDPEIPGNPSKPGSQNGLLSIYDCPLLGEKDIQYLPDECNELHWGSCQDISTKLARWEFRRKIEKRVKGLNSVDIEGYFHRIK